MSGPCTTAREGIVGAGALLAFARPTCALLAVSALSTGALAACNDVSQFKTRGGGFEGAVVDGSFVRAGIPEGVRLCLTLDTDHLQDTPGTLTTSDGHFHATPLRPIPQLWHDPLSTLAFGEGRERNLVYMATPSDGVDVTVVVSLMREGDVEVRLLRGAPTTGASSSPPSIFGVFALYRRAEPCF